MSGKLFTSLKKFESLIYDMAHQEINQKRYEIFGEPPSFDKEKNRLEPGKPVNINKLENILKEFMIY